MNELRERSRPTKIWLPALILALGGASVMLLLGTDFLRHRASNSDQARLNAVSIIELDIALIHLWLEEHVTGDRVDLPDITRRLVNSLALASALGGRGADPTEVIVLDSPALRAKVDELGGWLETFRSISEQRLDGFGAGDPVGIGSPIDRQYDAVFDEVFSQTQSLSVALRRRLEDRQRRSRQVFLAIVAAWSGLIMVSAGALWTREHRRRKTEADLRLSQQQLLQSQKMEAVGRLAGGLAHDLNNYLAATRGHCELVRIKKPSGEALVAKMGRTITLIDKAAAMIGRLQTFTHRQPPQSARVDLGAVVDSMSSMIGPTLGDDVQLSTSIDRDLWPVSADRTQIEQLIVNLLVNARDAMPRGGRILIEIFNRAKSPAHDDHVVLKVTDTGVGIPAELCDQIFEPFVTTKSGTGEAHSGLGLAIVYRIISGHGGRIEVDSEVGKGTTFELAFPRGSEDEHEAKPEPEEAEIDPRGDETILLVDDNDDFRETIRALLVELGYQVIAAENGESGLARAKEIDYAFDLVLTDVVMPGIGGRELVDRIRARHDVKVIFMSGHTERVLSRYGVEKGEVQVLKNLISGERLARRIRMLLDN